MAGKTSTKKKLTTTKYVEVFYTSRKIVSFMQNLQIMTGNFVEDIPLFSENGIDQLNTYYVLYSKYVRKCRECIGQ